ncbi:MAG: class I SAM-dependent methyltransferase [Bacteroidetes bacterium]|nr:class I SAM-dependent methyltransferase [Bacteroidota bacterium]
MTTADELKALVRSRTPGIIELGCGPNKKPGIIGIDQFPLPGVDFVTDLEHGLPFLESGSADVIISRHVLEHIENFQFLMEEIHRVLKPGGKKEVIVPHFSSPQFYSDFTHRRFFGLYSFDYFSDPGKTGMKRKVPSFYSTLRFRIVRRKLVFKSHAPVRNWIRQIFTRLFNLSAGMQEFYEENLCYLIPCQEIEFTLIPEKSADDPA